MLVEKTGYWSTKCMKFQSSLRATLTAQAKQSSQNETLPSSHALFAHQLTVVYRNAVNYVKGKNIVEWPRTSSWPVSKKLLESKIVKVSLEVSKACEDAITK